MSKFLSSVANTVIAWALSNRDPIYRALNKHIGTVHTRISTIICLGLVGSIIHPCFMLLTFLLPVAMLNQSSLYLKYVTHRFIVSRSKDKDNAARLKNMQVRILFSLTHKLSLTLSLLSFSLVAGSLGDLWLSSFLA